MFRWEFPIDLTDNLNYDGASVLTGSRMYLRKETNVADQQQEPLTESEMADLAQKLKMLGNELTPKEGRFLTEVLQNGIAMNKANEVHGYAMQSALQGETMYYPSSYKEQFGGGTTMAAASETRVEVAVVGHFNAP